MTALAIAAALGWVVAAILVVRGGRRAEAVARAAHEIAGPLHAAGLALSLARREGPAPRLAAAELELRRAARALEDLRGPAAHRPQDVDAGVLVAQQALAWQGAGPLRVTASTGALVHADPIRLAQAVGNLLANAFEHGRGQVELRVAAGTDGVRITVRDEGPGIAAPPRRPLALPPRGAFPVPARATAGLAGTIRGPFRPAPAARRGRGLAIAEEAIRGCGGRLIVAGGVPTLHLPSADPRRIA